MTYLVIAVGGGIAYCIGVMLLAKVTNNISIFGVRGKL